MRQKHLSLMGDEQKLKTRFRNAVKKVPFFGKAYLQRDELRALVNQLWVPAGHFYSPIPSVNELKQKEHEIFDNVPSTLPGIDLNVDRQLLWIDELRKYYKEQPFDSGPRDNLRYFFENNAFSYFDAVILYCMLRRLQPKRIIEVGSGHSSCVFLDTNELFLGNSVDCTFIEPYPELLMSLLKPGDIENIEFIPRRLEDVELSRFRSLSAGDMLFIDSSHISKTGSDVNYIIFEILPILNSGVFVHFHDIFYPFEYPREWVFQGRAWNEAYILRAFLQNNTQFTIQMFNSYLHQFHKNRIADAMPLSEKYAQQSMIKTSGQSIWLRKI